MIRYSGQLKTKHFNIRKKRVGRKKKTIKECLDIFTFDIEVTSCWIDPKKGVIGYEPHKDADYWNKLEKLSVPYIWQFSFNNEVYYGRFMEEFVELLNDLPKKTKMIIWVHSLGYEYGTFLTNIFKVKKQFSRSPHSPIYAVFEEFPDIMFRCSYVLTNMSLETWGDQLGLKKLVGDLDYTKLRTPLTDLTDKEMGYCERDCHVVYTGILDHLKIYNDVFDIPLTSTGKVRRPTKELLTNDKEYMKEIKRLVPRDLEEYQMFQDVFAGGYTKANRKYLDKVIREPVYHVDINSSYPFSLCAFKFPYNKWSYYGKVLPDPDTFEYRAYIIELHMTKVRVKSWNTYISASRCAGHKIISDNGRILTADEIWTKVTEQDLLTILEHYEFETIESTGTWVCHKRYLPRIFIDYILDMYKAKTELKHVDDVKYSISKAHLNSLYGMCVSSLIYSDVVYNDDGTWEVQELKPEQVIKKFEKMRRWFDKSYFLNFSAGCWVTAYSRRRIIRAISSIDEDEIYSDTDSIFYRGDHDFTWFNDEADELLKKMCVARDIDYEKTRPKDKDGVRWALGHLSSEPTSDAFRTLGSKKYIEERGGKLYMTISGVSKKAVTCLKSIEDFREGFEFDKDAENVSKNEITYLTNMPKVTFPDGFVSDIRFGINMRPTGYKLSKPRVYDLQDLIDKLMNPSDEEIIRRRGVVYE